MTPQEIAATIQAGTKMLSDGLLQVREYKNGIKVQDAAVDKQTRAQDIAAMLTTISTCLPPAVSIAVFIGKEIIDVVKQLTNSGEPIPLPEEFAALARLVSDIPSAVTMQLPADVQAILDAEK